MWQTKNHNRVLPLVAVICILIGAIGTTGYAGQLNNVVIVSIDALHPDAFQQARVPTLTTLMQNGAFTLDGHSTEPPQTLIAHTAMFTGLSPGESRKVDNDWVPGEATVQAETLFDSARHHGFKTGYFYSKEKLGYLVNDAIDVHAWSRDSAIDLAEAFIRTPGRHFVFLHISGLDQVGPQNGWLSPEYLEELSFIDDYLSSLIESIQGGKRYLIIVTSDHAGHEKTHGGHHPEDYRLPLVVCSDAVPVNQYQNISFSVGDLRKILGDLLQNVSS